MMPSITALIADDEPLLAGDLASQLQEQWPDLVLLDPVHDGLQAIERLSAGDVDLAFLDISMPGASGLEVAQAIAEEIPSGQVPTIVFVTAHDEFALQAFDLAAFDYLTKPVEAARLNKTIERLKQALASPDDVEVLAQRIGKMISGSTADRGSALTTIRAAVGQTVNLIPIDEVIMFEAADKYVNVATAGGDALIRESLRDLLPRLDPDIFVQIHRSRIVNMNHVLSAHRAEDGKLRLNLQGREETPIVSRVFSHLFRAM